MKSFSNIRVLLVDDEPSTHFLHQRVIGKAAPGASTISVMNGQEALEFIEKARLGEAECPTHIWLDLQMPFLDGWSFLESYSKLPENELCQPKITIVTSSHNPVDKIRAMQIPNVNGFVEKFVSLEVCRSLLGAEAT